MKFVDWVMDNIALNIILSFFTSGLWLCVWIVCSVIKYYETNKIKEQNKIFELKRKTQQEHEKEIEEKKHNSEFDEKLKASLLKEQERKKSNNKVYETCYQNLNYINPKISNKKEAKKFIKDMPELKFSNINSKSSLDTINTFVVIDTETTGLNAGSDELLEISAIKFIDSEPKDCLTTLLKPKKPISESIQSINNITNDMIKDSPSVEYIINDFNEFIKGFNIVGYNLEFDIKFLYRNGLDFFLEKRRFYDVLPMCRTTFRNTYLPNYKLDTICNYVGLKRNNAHRATEDALATGILFREIGYSRKNKVNKEYIEN